MQTRRIRRFHILNCMVGMYCTYSIYSHFKAKIAPFLIVWSKRWKLWLEKGLLLLLHIVDIYLLSLFNLIDMLSHHQAYLHSYGNFAQIKNNDACSSWKWGIIHNIFTPLLILHIFSSVIIMIGTCHSICNSKQLKASKLQFMKPNGAWQVP